MFEALVQVHIPAMCLCLVVDVGIVVAAVCAAVVVVVSDRRRSSTEGNIAFKNPPCDRQS